MTPGRTLAPPLGRPREALPESCRVSLAQPFQFAPQHLAALANRTQPPFRHRLRLAVELKASAARALRHAPAVPVGRRDAEQIPEGGRAVQRIGRTRLEERA